MASLLHEVWEDEHGMTLCLAGFGGPAVRASLLDGARLVATFEASSDAEAMSKYYEMFDLGTYKPFDSSAFDPYSDELKERQLKAIER